MKSMLPILLFLLSLFGTLIFKAVQNGPMDDYASEYDIEYIDVDQMLIASHFRGETWLENKMTSEMVDLNAIYQQKAFSKKLTKKSEVKRYQKSYGTWIEERKCFESPYFDKPMRSNITSRFGYRTHPLSGHRHIHAGIDFRGKTGTPVYAGSAGRVKTAKRKGNYGRTVIIDHGNSYTSLYGHLSGYAVKEGDWVNLGQTIGYVGRSGRATGPHLHFEVRCHNVPLDPMKYLGKMGKLAEVKFKRHRRHRFTRHRQPAVASHKRPKPVRDPNYYTRMINLQKIKKLKSQ